VQDIQCAAVFSSIESVCISLLQHCIKWFQSFSSRVGLKESGLNQSETLRLREMTSVSAAGAAVEENCLHQQESKMMHFLPRPHNTFLFHFIESLQK